MKQIYIMCEGPTEETFIQRLLAPSFAERGIFVTGIPIYGVSRYERLRNRIKTQCKASKGAVVTTMLDYYGIPSQTPRLKEDFSDIYRHIEEVESAIGQDIGQDNFIPNLILHEFEALLFSGPDEFSACGIGDRERQKLSEISEQFHNPELINNSPNTAPSKRILQIYPAYHKIVDGTIIAERIGLAHMRKKCPHFHQWLNKLEES